MGSRSTRSTKRVSGKMKQLKKDQYNEDEMECNKYRDADCVEAKGSITSKSTNNKTNRSTQANADEIDELIFDWKVPRVAGENEPIVNSSSTEIIPQCRLCLRRVSKRNLRVIFNKHKAKVLAAFRLKIYVNDAYPFACLNCLNLVDIFLDFRQIVMKSKNLLLSQKSYLENDGWDDSSLMEIIANCKTAVEQNRKHIDTIYEQYTKTLNRNVESIKNEADLKVKIETFNIPEIQMKSQINEQCLKLEDFEDQSSTSNDAEIAETDAFESISDGKNIKKEQDSTETVDKKLEADDESDYDVHNDDDEDEDDDEDYRPKPEVIKSKRPLPCSSDSDDSIESIPDDKKKRKKKMTIKKQSKSRLGRKPKFTGLSEEQKKQINWDYKHQLCDFCGETVTSAAAEAHKNKHLGIKPYKCLEPGCELTFHSQTNQAAHMKRLHSESGMPVMECNICGQLIRGNLKVLNYHKKHHTQEKKHVCTVCGKGFTMKSYLRQHGMVHSGEFPHKCSYCGKRFNNKWSMRTHERNIHEKRNNTSAPQLPASSSNSASWDQNVPLAPGNDFQNSIV